MSEQVWVKAERRDDGYYVIRRPPHEAEFPVGVYGGIHPDDVVPASELQRVTPPLPQTTEEWQQCIGRSLTRNGVGFEYELLAVRGEEAWVLNVQKGNTAALPLADFTALDPPWVPEGPEEGKVLGWVGKNTNGTFTLVHRDKQKAASYTDLGGRLCRVVAVGDGER